ncbi:MerR family transcriptional regulator [Roseomonas elaeocarpi]|uniref:Helix-turn-helix domain-containing protein n=1 Tax=Roseomonas elaeocarpi TaxID=907779 RepID=A0ABV6JW34_9PROT
MTQPSPAGPALSIGELSRRAGVKPTTIRFYEAERLLPPPSRTEGGHRVFGETHLRRLGFIRHARELGFPMPAIRALLELERHPADNCASAHDIAMAQVAEIDRRLVRLAALRRELLHMAEGCRGGRVEVCRVLETLADFDHGHCDDPAHGAAAEGVGEALG